MTLIELLKQLPQYKASIYSGAILTLDLRVIGEYEVFQHGDIQYKTNGLEIDNKLKSIEIY